MSSSSLQDLRRAMYVRAKADASWRFWGLWVHICKRETLAVKTEVRCPPITEVRCPLFTGYRVQSSRMMRVWECGHLARREMSKVRRTGISTRRRSVMLMPPRSPRPLSCVGRASRPFSFPVAGSSRL